MFCLRSWIPILFFLTNASPIYLVLFVSATYVLNRPCVYCSLLLAILVISLFDFHTDDWFEPRYRSVDNFSIFSSAAANQTSSSSSGYYLGGGAGSALNASMIIPEAVKDALSYISLAANASVTAAAQHVWSGARQAVGEVHANNSTVTGAGEWFRGLLRKEWRIGCLDVVLRL